MKGRKRKGQTEERSAQRIPPPPSDSAVRLAAMLTLMREQVDAFERGAFAGDTLTIDLADVNGSFVDELLPGTTVEQTVARLLVAGIGWRGIAGGLGLPGIIVRGAIEDLAHGARVDWTPREAVA